MLTATLTAAGAVWALLRGYRSIAERQKIARMQAAWEAGRVVGSWNAKQRRLWRRKLVMYRERLEDAEVLDWHWWNQFGDCAVEGPFSLWGRETREWSYAAKVLEAVLLGVGR